jgi:SAM-dependent methyltransferase
MRYRKEAPTTFDGSWATQYREGDEKVVGSGSREHYGDVLRSLSSTFGRAIDVLDVGCGTGRYFHCLRNVRRLVGIDISPHMLVQARNPVKNAELEIREIELRCGDIYALDLGKSKFDFIYSIGVLGEYSPINDALLDKFFDALTPGGKLFMTAVDSHSRLQMVKGDKLTIVRRTQRLMFPFLPPFVRTALNRALSSSYLTEAELTSLMRKSKFGAFSISRYRHPSGWRGAHLDCRAEKLSA